MKSTRMTFLPTNSPIVTPSVFTKPDGAAISTYGVPFCAAAFCMGSWTAPAGAKRKASPTPRRPMSTIPTTYSAFILVHFLEQELFYLGDIEVSAIEDSNLQFLLVSKSYREAEDQKQGSYAPLEMPARIRKR